jgi:hypothetical protein
VPRYALRVMSEAKDPFWLDTPTNHRIGEWFAEQIDKFSPNRSVHLRGFHYMLIGTIRPDGTAYANTHKCWEWIQAAGKAARWLGHIAWDRIHDGRNEDPVWLANGSADIPIVPVIERALGVSRGALLSIEIPELAELLPEIGIACDHKPTQGFRLGLIGEKSSLRPVVMPWARRVGADVVLDTGNASDSHIFQLVERAAADKRPFILLYLSDFDPSGWGMPSEVARKVQALRDLLFPELDCRLYPVALTLEQCREFDLPSAPLKETEQRAPKWIERWGGHAQTEVDSLLALRPGALEDLLDEAVRPFFDPTLEARYRLATRTPDEVLRWFAGLPEVGAAATEIARLHASATASADELADAVQRGYEAVRDAVADADDAPVIEDIEIAPDIEGDPPEPLFHSLEEWVTATRRLREHRGGDE